MIPKIIHYVWLGNGDFSSNIERCIQSWHKFMPDYEFRCWTESSFDIKSLPWVEEAIEKKKWALAADYIRLYALYTVGGIYMDTDVEVLKPFDDFLHWDFFTSVEYHPNIFKKFGQIQVDKKGNLLVKNDVVEGLGLLSAIIGAQKGHPFIRECMRYYEARHFVRSNGALDLDVIIPGIMATIAVKYGFRFKNEQQLLENNMMIYDSSIFASSGWYSDRRKNYAIHFADGSWRNYTKGQKLIKKIKQYVPLCIRRMIRRQ